MLIIEQKSLQAGRQDSTKSHHHEAKSLSSSTGNKQQQQQRIDCLSLATKLKVILGKGSKDDRDDDGYFTKISPKADRGSTIKAASSVRIPESATEILRRRRSRTRTFPAYNTRTRQTNPGAAGEGEGEGEAQHQRSFTIHEFPGS